MELTPNRSAGRPPGPGPASPPASAFSVTGALRYAPMLAPPPAFASAAPFDRTAKPPATSAAFFSAMVPRTSF